MQSTPCMDAPVGLKQGWQEMHNSDNERNSSSKQASTFQASGNDGAVQRIVAVGDSGCTLQIPVSPFNAQNVQIPVSSGTLKAKHNVRFADTPSDSCCDDNLASERANNSLDIPERTKSRLMAEIADEVSRNSQTFSLHARRSSADSQDMSREPSTRTQRKRSRWQLSKAASAPEDVCTVLPSLSWMTSNPEEGQNWANCNYLEMQPGVPSQPKGLRTDSGAARARPAQRKRYAGRQRTSRFIGVGSSNRKTQWQARILVQGKVTHLGYYSSEVEAASIYDRIALSLNPAAQTNFPASNYPKGGLTEFSGLGREDLQRALGVKPMDKSSRFRGVSRKKGKWEAKVMVNRKWAYRALFESEAEAAHAYDAAVWRLKPKEATSFVNFKDGVSIRDTPSQSPKKEKLPKSPSLPTTTVKIEPAEVETQAEQPGMTLRDMHLVQCESSRPPAEPLLRSQTVQLPLQGSSLPRTGSCAQLPTVNQLHTSSSMSLELGLNSQGSFVSNGPVDLSPQRSICADQAPHLPPVLPVAVPVLDLPDPNSIGVPPPIHVPFPDLVTAGSVPSTPLRRAPSGLFANAQMPSPKHAPSPGLPPLLARSQSVLEPEASASYLSGSLSQVSTALPFTQRMELPPNPSLANPFYHAAALPRVSTQPDLCGLQGLPSYTSQSSQLMSCQSVPLNHSAVSDGVLPASQLNSQLSYSASVPEMAMGQLPTHGSLASMQSSYYVPPATRMTICESQPLGDMFPGVALPQMDSAMNLGTARNLANSRSASSNFLQAATSNLMRTSSANSGMPMYHGELGTMRTDPTHTLPKLHASLSLDANYASPGELIAAQPTVSLQPPLADARALNPEQADLLNSLDVDVGMVEPVPLNPVHIGGEDMNVYSPHIMGDLLV